MSLVVSLHTLIEVDFCGSFCPDGLWLVGKLCSVDSLIQWIFP
jgi:hypothetical protein